MFFLLILFMLLMLKFILNSWLSFDLFLMLPEAEDWDTMVFQVFLDFGASDHFGMYLDPVAFQEFMASSVYLNSPSYLMMADTPEFKEFISYLSSHIDLSNLVTFQEFLESSVYLNSPEYLALIDTSEFKEFIVYLSSNVPLNYEMCANSPEFKVIMDCLSWMLILKF